MKFNLKSIYNVYLLYSKKNDHNMLKYGHPNTQNLRYFDNYISSYDCERRIPRWCIHYLNESNIIPRQKKKFNFRNLENNDFIPKKNYYKPYSRGHLVPSGDFNKDSDKENTFILEANIIPQNKENNEGIWNRLEFSIRKIIKKYSEIWIITGPVFIEDNYDIMNYHVLKNGLAVPNYIYKAILFNFSNKMYLNTYLIPNQNVGHTDYNKYLINYSYIEKKVGYNLFDKINKSTVEQNILV